MLKNAPTVIGRATIQSYKEILIDIENVRILCKYSCSATNFSIT
jgi:hypothetical protein